MSPVLFYEASYSYIHSCYWLLFPCCVARGLGPWVFELAPVWLQGAPISTLFGVRATAGTISRSAAFSRCSACTVASTAPSACPMFAIWLCSPITIDSSSEALITGGEANIDLGPSVGSVVGVDSGTAAVKLGVVILCVPTAFVLGVPALSVTPCVAMLLLPPVSTGAAVHASAGEVANS